MDSALAKAAYMTAQIFVSVEKLVDLLFSMSWNMGPKLDTLHLHFCSVYVKWAKLLKPCSQSKMPCRTVSHTQYSTGCRSFWPAFFFRWQEVAMALKRQPWLWTQTRILRVRRWSNVCEWRGRVPGKNWGSVLGFITSGTAHNCCFDSCVI